MLAASFIAFSPSRLGGLSMSYKVILFGILLLLAIPAASSAQVFYQASAKGTSVCSDGATNKVKETLFIGFLLPDVAFETLNIMAIGTDLQFNNVLAHMEVQEIFAMSLTTGGFIFNQNDADGIAMFAGTFKNDANTGVLTSFTGTLDAVNLNTGCFERLTIKSKGIVQ
jgi:hypothetical protein